MPSTIRASARRLARASFGLLAAFVATPAFACSVTSATLSFGVINPLTDGQRDSTGSISVTCPVVTSYTVTLSSGNGSYDQRALLSGGRTLNYNLYIDTQRTQIWGDGSGATWTVSGSADSTSTTHTIYGSVPVQPYAVPASYVDTIMITVVY